MAWISCLGGTYYYGENFNNTVTNNKMVEVVSDTTPLKGPNTEINTEKGNNGGGNAGGSNMINRSNIKKLQQSSEMWLIEALG